MLLVGLDGIGWIGEVSPGWGRYRAPYGTNNNIFSILTIFLNKIYRKAERLYVLKSFGTERAKLVSCISLCVAMLHKEKYTVAT